MFARPKNWISGGLWKPKNPHSLEHLKYLYNVLGKNQTVTEQNRSLLVETLRSISEILIWGDQNDSSVFDFFLEKNMLSFFLRFMRQKSGRYICVQLLQTLNILFENISNETSVYYLLSNNHINSIIVHKFDFSDEEVMAYYISFLKTLSLKLNKHTIHFFYNEHTNDFALYTEAIKFFNHPETMVRIAVRTITLNVYKVDEKSMLRYIRDKTAAPYFSNLVWFIGNHVLELDICVRHDIDHNSRGRLSDLVAEHLDHLHYLNDILCLNIDALNEVLTDHLLNRLLIPLYVYSLTKRKRYAPRSDDQPHVSSVVSLFFLSQVFLIMHHSPLVMQLADIILNGDLSVCQMEPSDSPQAGGSRVCGFVKPLEPLAKTLDQVRGASRKKPSKRPNYKEEEDPASPAAEPPGPSTPAETTPAPSEGATRPRDSHIREGNSTFYNPDADDQEMEEEDASEANKSNEAEVVDPTTSAPPAMEDDLSSPNQNSTDEEKLLHHLSGVAEVEFTLTNRPYLNSIFLSLECSDNDYEALFALCLLYAMGHNSGIHQDVLDKILMPTHKSPSKGHYNIALIEKMISILSKSCQNGSRVRLATLELSILLLKTMVYKETQCYLQDRHLAALEGAREEATLQLRNFYKVWEKSEEIFLDMFEDEFREMQNRPLNVEYLTMDASILLPPTGTPLTGIDFNKRLPCGEVERARRAIRVFFHMRDLSLTLRQEQETQLPLTKVEECVRKGDVLDLNNSDLIACTVITKENRKERRFLVIDVLQLILVEPDSHKLGWGVVKFVGFLQDVEVTGDKEDSRSLHITIHKPATNMHARPIPLLSARFLFDDHIRCMAAKQRLTKGRLRARQRKMQMIARLLELPTHIVESMYQPSSSGSTLSAATLRTSSSTSAIPGRSHPVPQRSAPDSHPPLLRTHSEVLQRSVFSAVETTAAFQTARDQNVAANTRQLPRHLATSRQVSRPITIRGSRPGGATRQRPVQGNIQRVMEEAGVEVVGGVESSTAAVDEAEEATPSPEAHARQSLNPHQPVSPAPDTRGTHSRSSSTESTSSRGPQEIQMEDLSKRGRRNATPTRHDPSPLSSHRRHSSPLVEEHKTRSGSASPKRGRRGSGSPAPRGRSSQVTRASSKDGPKQKTDPKTADPNSVEVTSFIKESDNSSPNKKITSSQKKRGKRQVSSGRRGSGPSVCPKSLTPAQEPSVSLVTSCTPPKSSQTEHVGSPKLLPPAETDRLPSYSDASSSTQDNHQVNTDTPVKPQTVTADPNNLQKPPFLMTSQTEPTVGESPITADLTRLQMVAPPSESTSQQLSKLAHMVAPPGESTSQQLSNLANIMAPPCELSSAHEAVVAENPSSKPGSEEHQD